MRCLCVHSQEGYGTREWEQIFDGLPRKGDRVIDKEGRVYNVNYCVHRDGELVEVVMKNN